MVGSEGYRRTFVETKIAKWCDKLKHLSKIAWDEPQAAYCAFSEWIQTQAHYYLIGKIPGISSCFKRLDEIILAELLPPLTGGINFNQHERLLISLPPKNGGLGIPIFEELRELISSTKTPS